MWRVRSHDHRGLPIRLYRTGLLPTPFAGEHAIDRETWRRICATLARRMAANWPDRPPGTPAYFSWRGTMWLLLPAAWLLVSALLATILARYVSSPAAALVPLGLIALAAMYWWYFRHSLEKGPPDEVARALLEESLCAQCGYPLTPTPEEADGCRVCPECGAAWRIGEPAPPFSPIG